MLNNLSVLSAEYVFSIIKLLINIGQKDAYILYIFFIYNNSKAFCPLISFFQFFPIFFVNFFTREKLVRDNVCGGQFV